MAPQGRNRTRFNPTDTPTKTLPTAFHNFPLGPKSSLLVMATEALEWKAKGNAALSAKDFDGAIEAYSKVRRCEARRRGVQRRCGRP